MYTLQASTEFLKSHKAGQVVSDQSLFKVLQTSAGQSLFFGISDSNILYLSAEQEKVATGWTPIDLTTELAALFPGKTVTAKSFGVEQSPTTGNILIVQIVHIAETNSDALFALVDLPNAPDAGWLTSPANRKWVARPFDDTDHPVTTLDLAYVELPVSDDPQQTPYVAAGVRDPKTQFIQNFLVNMQASTGVWKLFPTAENFDAMSDMSIGKPQGAPFPGLYELYTLSGTPSLTFTPWRGLFGPPDVTKLNAPAGASSITTTPTGANGSTDLYVAATGGIYFYAANNQGNFSPGVQIISSPMMASVVSLEAHVAGTQLTLWGRSNDGVVFYSRCSLGSQAAPGAWSAPIPIQQGVDQLTSMLNLQTQTSVLFAHTQGQQVLKLTQDPVTTAWRTQSILLPYSNVKNDVVLMYTYTTHISIVDDNNLPVPNQSFALTSTSPCTVYIDNLYTTLSHTVPVQVQSDARGSITIVQETQTMGAVCYNLVQGNGSNLNVNPMSMSVQRMSVVQNGKQLRALQITDEWNNTQLLVPSSVPPTNSDSVAQGITQFVKTSTTVPQDGTVQPPSATRRRTFNAATDAVWGMKFNQGTITYYEGPDQMAALGLSFGADGVVALKNDKLELKDVGDGFESWAGDIWAWLEHAWDSVEQFFVQVVDGVTRFFIQIGEALYHFVMECYNDVVSAIKFILNAIEVAIEKLIQWIGFIFSWGDIVRTHKVLKNIFKQYANYALQNIGTYKGALQTAFTNVENAINQWAGLPPIPDSAGSSSKSGQRPQGSDSPQAHYGTYQAKSNVGSASSQYSPGFASGSTLEQLLNEFSTMLDREGDAFTNAYQSFKTDVVDQIASLSITDIIKKMLAIIADLVLETVENAVVSLVDIIAILVEGIVSFLDSPIDIPVLSYLYSLISGGDSLSFLDLACLIVAIPVTVICKLVMKETPFPDNAFTSSIINAPDFASIQRLYGGQFSFVRSGTGNRAAAAAVAQMDPKLGAILNFAGNVCAYFGTLGLIIFGSIKFVTPEVVPIAVLFSISYIFYVAPDIMPLITQTSALTWDVIMNATVCAVTVVKTFVDISLTKFEEGVSGSALTLWNKISPAADCFFNIIWQIPVMVPIFGNQHPDTIVGLVANTSFDAGGWITPGTAYPPNPVVKAAFFAGTLVCAGIYGELTLVQGFMDFSG
ncbi:MAG TPA: hypothetical protein VN633_10130 [Bryobacteraceae bacterium]|nr:hypothetical protein [Bryobacteraceae bacterium]